MSIRTILLLALLPLLLPSPGSRVAGQEPLVTPAPAQSPSMLLFPVDEVAPAGSLQVLVVRPKEGASAVGAGATFGLLSRVRLVAHLGVGRPDPTARALRGGSSGWYVGGSLLGVWTLAGGERTGIDLVVGVQADHATSTDATRTSAPSALTARLTTSIGTIDFQPFVGGGVALRNDNVEAYREWNSNGANDGGATAGWFAHTGVRVASGRFWVQPSMTWSKVFSDGGFPHVLVSDGLGQFSSVAPSIQRTPLLTLRAGFSP